MSNFEPLDSESDVLLISFANDTKLLTKLEDAFTICTEFCGCNPFSGVQENTKREIAKNKNFVFIILFWDVFSKKRNRKIKSKHLNEKNRKK